MSRREKRLRISGEIISTKVSNKKMYFAINNKIAELGDSAKEYEAGDSAVVRNYRRDFMK